MLLLAWPLAVFGGRGLFTGVAFSAACVVFALAVCVRHGFSADVSSAPQGLTHRYPRLLDLCLYALAAVPVVQLLPLPPAIAALLSPHLADLRGALALGATDGWPPLTLSTHDTAWAAAVVIGAVALFVGARALFAAIGVRHALRGLCAIGFVVSAIAIAQAATAGRLIYWRFPTEYEGPLPFGPFVNRNHFATWAIMVLPLSVGYIAARLGHRRSHAHRTERHPRARVAHLVDGRMLWLTVSGAMMLAALLLSASRSGIVALAASGAITVLVTRHRATGRGGRGLLALLAIMLVFAVVRADVSELSERFGRGLGDVQQRTRIWRDTLPVVADFWLAGTGAGTYQTSMLVYQRSHREVQFNQAHNHYLQAAAEGGLLLVVPLVCALWSLVKVGAERVAAEPAGAFWIRAGAACGLAAVALQSVWEAGLVMPANAALAAVVAAILVHDRLPVEAAA